ncbi:MAG: DUF2169 domain-containing protein [Candidatus Electrothrix aestuarii]|uniref:DUF2169 domain-containing protein n=1 Tax=Candidatus Electrothrix aestuarii TaxID=3062594 RepID=A0AAU8LVI9_9BACT|nr:DUF2169 domain-containing protein [Candidatus Electrothrix aestuarii]
MISKQPTFFLRKPDTLSLLYNLDEKSEERGKQLTVSILSGFRLHSTPELLEEGDFWQPVKELDAVPFDLGMPKPAGEFLVAGTCYSPDGQSTLACPVRAKVGSVTKNLLAFGDRWWISNTKVTFPVPFKSMDLGWERSFGGTPGYDNPLGRGLEPVLCPDGKERKPLPNIQHPDRLLRSPFEQQDPVGFGPEGLDWPSRRALAGSLNDTWLAHRWPKPPSDASPQLSHLAPPDQRFPDFLQGDESIRLHNMHPERSLIESQLPGRRCRCFLGNRSADQTFLEMQCHLDTLWLFPNHETGILIWRAGLAELPAWNTEEFYLAASLEPLTEAPQKAASCYRAIIPLSPLSEAEAKTESTATTEPKPDSSSESDKEKRAESEQKGTTPQVDPVAAAIAEKTAAAKAKLTPLLASFGISADELLGQSATAQAGQGAQSLTPAHLAQRSAHLHKELDKMLLRTGLTQKDIQLDDVAQVAKPKKKADAARIATAIAAMKSFGIEDEALFAEMRTLEQQAEQVKTAEQKKRPDRTGSHLPLTAVMTRDEVIDAYTRGESLAGMNLSGLDLSGLVLDQADFRGAVLEGVNFTQTSLQGADCREALLNNADCTHAILTNCNLQDCVATKMLAVGANFSGADLSKSRFDTSDFSRARLTKVKASRAKFAACMLTEVDARNADMEQAVFKGADLTAIHCTGTNLRRTNFNRALLDRANFSDSNLEGAWFAEAEGDETLFCRAKLSRSKCNSTTLANADFSEAEMVQLAWSESIFLDAIMRHGILDQAMLAQCDFRRADFSRTSLKQANLMYSDLRQSSFYKSNAFKVRFRHAHLEESNCCDANFYGADLYKASLQKTLLDGTNLDATLFAVQFPI